MANNSVRMARLLSLCGRQMNGAVADSMTYYGAKYGLNYGVSLPTLRSIAKEQPKDSDFALYLLQQQVRELRLAAMWIMEAQDVDIEAQTDAWSVAINNSEVAEEAAFALMRYVDGVEQWLEAENYILQLCALWSLSYRNNLNISNVITRLESIVALDLHPHAVAIVALLESISRMNGGVAVVSELLARLPQNRSAQYIIEECEWRLATI